VTWLRKMIAMSADRCGAPGLLRDLAHLIRALKILFDPYRPEQHYMRGPGPKWHAKHDPAHPSLKPSATCRQRRLSNVDLWPDLEAQAAGRSAL
jgi:hypothetical protein